VGNFNDPLGLLHLGLFGGHAESLIKVRVEDFDALLFKPADDFLALGSLVDLMDVDAFAAAPRKKDRGFVPSPDSVSYPPGAR
jgi:hypothetical protein